MAAPMDRSMRSSEADIDDWFFASVKMYDQLHMFDLHNPATAMCWISNDRVCVVGSSKPGKGEILELSLPSKLLASEEGLVKDRDFDVISGTYYEQTIGSVQRVSDKFIVTSETGENIIQTWILGDETTDEARVAVPPHTADRVLFGDAVCRLCLVDLQTGKYIYQVEDNCEDRICGLDFMDENTFLCCSQSSGDLWRFDLRQGPSQVKCHKWEGVEDGRTVGQWASDFSFGEKGTAGVIVRMSDKGHVIVSDLRQPDTWVKKADIRESQTEVLQIKVCPNNPDLISTTNSHGEVLLYDTGCWTRSSPDVATEYFRHKGHWVNSEGQEAVVRAHMWHPTCQPLVLSAASDGSLHAWTPAR